MTRWSPGTALPGGPAASQLRLRKLAGVVDLTIERANLDEVTIATDLLVADAFVAREADQAYAPLIAWASGLAYRRVWFGHEVVALKVELLGGSWSSTCRHCGSTWSDSTPGFWLTARAVGYFPLICSFWSHPLSQRTGVRSVSAASVRFEYSNDAAARSAAGGDLV